ncbi:Hypothetical Protein FCC1311_058042 [Hondaea fermentalgiana]|uniref:Uncharacterized protein n=1 Tax=Hondaea fermentalgiana TaxID=2315210 RepID=A0A2R5GLS8_9STRA|nr:Hypothetical Protein FCC1311_058042 [Hondaea fermentalgiana]|eukprot:GBG29583.1 Hypothetical Protein FCC1311_058042 [Hondaea fermentalgiana]
MDEYIRACVSSEVSAGVAEAARWGRSPDAWTLGARACALSARVRAVDAARFAALQRIAALLEAEDPSRPWEDRTLEAKRLEAALFERRARAYMTMANPK